MKNYKIIPVSSSSDAKKFREVPLSIYHNDPNWVRPWDHDIEAVFDPTQNERFADGDAHRWILTDDGIPIGRIAAFYNREDAAKEAQPTGGCGFFECPDDQQAANLLLDTAREWLSALGMEAMDGSVNFGDRLLWWGVLVEGFTMPLYGMNYNPPYYANLFETYGFQNYFNQHTYLRPLTPDIVMDDLLHQKANRLLENPEYNFTTFDKSQPEKMARDFMEVYNSGWAKFEGVKPLNYQHSSAMIHSMLPIIDPNALYMAYHGNTPIGFFVMVPDLNQIIRHLGGKFGLLQKLKLIWHLKVRKSVNRLNGIIFGVAAEYQGKGVESAMIRKFEIYTQQQRESRKEQYKTLEMQWVGDFNPVMMRMCEGHVKAVKFKRHITYRYLFDREKPFERCPRLGKTKKVTATPPEE